MDLYVNRVQEKISLDLYLFTWRKTYQGSILIHVRRKCLFTCLFTCFFIFLF